MAAIYAIDGMVLVRDLAGAIREWGYASFVARRLAMSGQPVVLEDDDGTWLMSTHGPRVRYSPEIGVLQSVTITSYPVYSLDEEVWEWRIVAADGRCIEGAADSLEQAMSEVESRHGPPDWRDYTECPDGAWAWEAVTE